MDNGHVLFFGLDVRTIETMFSAILRGPYCQPIVRAFITVPSETSCYCYFFIKLNVIIGLFALDAALIFFNKNLPFTGDERYSIYYLYLKINKYVIDLNLFFNEALIVFFT